MKLMVLALALLVSACGGSGNPLGPSQPASLRYPAELAPVIRTLDNDAWVHPLIGSMGAYVRQHVTEIRFDTTLQPPLVGMAYAGGTIGWRTYDAPPTYDMPGVETYAAYVLHEARHLDGLRWHSCQNGNDRTFEEGGAWAVHIIYLEHAGFQAEADLVRKTFIGC